MGTPIEATESPWWLAWILPVLGLFTAVGSLFIYLGRWLLLGAVKDEFEKILDERHDQNRAEFDEIREQLKESHEDRKAMRTDMAKITADVAYLRGRERIREKDDTGSYKKP